MQSECSSPSPKETHILVLSQENPVRSTPYSPTFVTSILILPCLLFIVLQSGLIFLKFRHQNSADTSFFSTSLSISSPFISPPEKYLARIEFIKQFSLFSHYSPLLGTNNFLSNLFPNALSIRPFLNWETISFTYLIQEA